jgi:16S rRNA (cytidine1402-2'-O)-methyltransferase
VLATLAAMAKAFGPERPAAVTRELTKLHEEVLRGTLAELGDRLAAQGPRGEITLVVGGAPGPTGPDRSELAGEVARLVSGGTSTRDAVGTVARATGTPRRAVYQAVLDARAHGPAARQP